MIKIMTVDIPDESRVYDNTNKWRERKHIHTHTHTHTNTCARRNRGFLCKPVARHTNQQSCRKRHGNPLVNPFRCNNSIRPSCRELNVNILYTRTLPWYLGKLGQWENHAQHDHTVAESLPQWNSEQTTLQWHFSTTLAQNPNSVHINFENIYFGICCKENIYSDDLPLVNIARNCMTYFLERKQNHGFRRHFPVLFVASLATTSKWLHSISTCLTCPKFWRIPFFFFSFFFFF